MTDKLELEKKIKMLIGQSGVVLRVNPDGSINANIVDSVSADTVDNNGGWITIDNTEYFEIVRMNSSVGITTFLKEICISLIGFSAEFVVEKFDGTDLSVIRRYNLNTQQSSFSEVLGNAIPLEHNDDGPYIVIKAKMNWQNKSGRASGALNGFK